MSELTPTACPGCGKPKSTPGDYCEFCEFSNLASGWYHYCGKDSCYCRELRRFHKRSVLNVFAAAFQAAEAAGLPPRNDPARRQVIREHLAAAGIAADCVAERGWR
mgnify:CR=1 FL=1